jgi:DNA-binding SARP family transcriptional activator
LNTSEEWILANLIDVLRQSIFQPLSVPVRKNWQPPRTQPFEDALAIVLDGLQHWGFSPHNPRTEPEETFSSQTNTGFTLIQSFFSIQHWQGHWRTLLLAFRGELRLQWTKQEKPAARKRFALWKSFLISLRSYPSGREDHAPASDALEPGNPSLLPPAREIAIPRASSHEQKLLPLIVDDERTPHPEPTAAVLPVSVHMLGTFKMTIGDSAVKLPASRAASLLKYLLFHHEQTTPREVLMDIFWPDAEPEMARNNLNVALHSLRRALRTAMDLPVIVFEEGAYGLAPNLQVWLDIEEFERCIKAGQRLEGRNQPTAAIADYEAAVSLYQGDFLEQSPYEEWTILDRERLRIAYLDTLDRLSQIYFKEERYTACRTACQLILNAEPCREDAHCLLMRCYSRQRQQHLALYQYQVCVEALRSELQVEPAPETTELYHRIRRREQV